MLPEFKQVEEKKISRNATIRNDVVIEGIGIHSGSSAVLTIHPESSGTGLFFFRKKNKDDIIKVHPENVKNTFQAVTLSNGSYHVQTIEHLLAALAVAGITDASIELSGDEIPIMDGSAQPYYEAVQSAGLIYFPEEVIPIKLSSPVWVVEGDKYLVALPDDEASISYSIDYDHPLLRNQTFQVLLKTDDLGAEILPARTFGFIRDLDEMKSKGLIKGASLENAVGLTEDGYLNPSLRFENECIRHKILDLIGDLYLLNRPLKARILASRAGHKLDVALALKISQMIEN